MKNRSSILALALVLHVGPLPKPLKRNLSYTLFMKVISLRSPHVKHCLSLCGWVCTAHISSDSSILIVRYNSKGVVDGWSLLLLIYYSGLVKVLCHGCLAKNVCGAN